MIDINIGMGIRTCNISQKTLALLLHEQLVKKLPLFANSQEQAITNVSQTRL